MGFGTGHRGTCWTLHQMWAGSVVWRQNPEGLLASSRGKVSSLTRRNWRQNSQCQDAAATDRLSAQETPRLCDHRAAGSSQQ